MPPGDGLTHATGFFANTPINLGGSPPQPVVIPNPNLLPVGPVQIGFAVQVEGVPGYWVAIQNMPLAHPLPIGQRPTGQPRAFGSGGNPATSYGVAGSDEFWHYSYGSS